MVSLASTQKFWSDLGIKLNVTDHKAYCSIRTSQERLRLRSRSCDHLDSQVVMINLSTFNPKPKYSNIHPSIPIKVFKSMQLKSLVSMSKSHHYPWEQLWEVKFFKGCHGNLCNIYTTLWCESFGSEILVWLKPQDSKISFLIHGWYRSYEIMLINRCA